MHLLIGFGIVIGLVAFAFGEKAAQVVVGAVLIGIPAVFIIGFTYLAWDELRPARTEKITAAYRTTPPAIVSKDELERIRVEASIAAYGTSAAGRYSACMAEAWRNRTSQLICDAEVMP